MIDVANMIKQAYENRISVIYSTKGLKSVHEIKYPIKDMQTIYRKISSRDR